MGLSETILAAMIGAAATMLTALSQLMMSLRAKAKAETRPKRNAMRSLMWMLALLVASAVGERYLVQVGVPLDQRDAALRRFLSLLIWSLPVTLLAVLIVGKWMAGWALAPLARLAASTRTMTGPTTTEGWATSRSMRGRSMRSAPRRAR